MSYHLGMLAAHRLARRKISFRKIFYPGNCLVLITSGVSGVTGGLLLYLLWPLLGIPAAAGLHLESIGLNSTSWPFFIVYFILVNAFIEELFWRGLLGSDLKRITLNDFIFSGYHIIVLAGWVALPWLVLVFFFLALAAWFWRQADRWNQGLFPSVLSHLMADALIILVIYFMTVRG